jgi:hypothetical protein
VSCSTGGDEAESEGKVLFKRLGATHELQYGMDELQVKLPTGGVKVLQETRPIGFTLRNTKMFASDEFILTKHRHWGMNIAMGGHGCYSMTNELVSANGEHGHMYMYYQSPASRRNGGLLIGVEGSEYNKFDQSGHVHSLKADSSRFSPTYGYKWIHKPKKKHKKSDSKKAESSSSEEEDDISPKMIQQDMFSENNAPAFQDLSSCGGPPKMNGIIVDLSAGWRFLQEKVNEWDDDMVMETSKLPDYLVKKNTSARKRSKAVVPQLRESPVPTATTDNNDGSDLK